MIWRVVIRTIRYTDFFVANVNWNDDRRLKVNVNHFSNDNVWNADNRNRVVLPLLTFLPSFIWWEFLFATPASSRQVADQFLRVELRD
ncbi:MAG: hypothetical protein AAB455_01100 [Patescibacteria group bacterium]